MGDIYSNRRHLLHFLVLAGPRHFKDFVKTSLFKEDFKEFEIPKGIYLTSLNYDTGLKSALGKKNTIIEALKEKDINNIDNNKLILINSYDKLIKFRQFY